MVVVTVNDPRNYDFLTESNVSLIDSNGQSLDPDDTLANAFSITVFKTNFNEFINKLYNIAGYDVDEVFKFYYSRSKSLSNCILRLITHALYYSRNKIKKNDFNTINLYSTTIDGIRERSVSVNGRGWDIERYRREMWNKYRNGRQILENDFQNNPWNGLHTYLFNQGLFQFYNYIYNIEVTNPDNYLARYLQDLALDVNQFFFYSELLLKLSLDTEANISANNTRTITTNYNTYNNENGLMKPNDWSSWSIRNNRCYNRGNKKILNGTIYRNMRNKLLYQIYNTIKRIERKNNSLSNSIITTDMITKNINDIDQKTQKRDSYIMNIRTMQKKNNEITNVNKNNIIKFSIALIILLVFIGINVAMSLKGNNQLNVMSINTTNVFKGPNKRLLQFNIFVIVIIFILKFYYLFK